MKPEIGLNETDRKKLSDELSRLLADSYTLYLKTHNFHWNVTGPMFQTLHRCSSSITTSWRWRSTPSRSGFDRWGTRLPAAMPLSRN